MISFRTTQLAVWFLLAVLCGHSAFAKAPRMEIRFEHDTLTPFARSQQLLESVTKTLRDHEGAITIRGYIDSTEDLPDRNYLFEQRTRYIEGMLKEWLDHNPGWHLEPAVLSDNFSNQSRTFDPNLDDSLVMEVEFRESVTPREKYKVKGLTQKGEGYKDLGTVTILYHPSSTKLYPGGERELTAAVQARPKNQVYVRVTSYSDNDRTSKANAEISKQRAEGVVSYLQTLGIPRERFLFVNAVAGPTNRATASKSPQRRVDVEFVTESEFTENREIVYEEVPVPCPPAPVGRETVPDTDKVWLGHFGLAQALDYYNFMVSLEHRLSEHITFGPLIFEQASVRAGFAGRLRGLAIGAGVNFYSMKDYQGLWIRFAATYQMVTLSQGGTQSDFLPGMRVNIGYVLAPDFPFRLRLSGGLQQTSEGNFQNVFGGVTPFIQIELGTPW